MAPYERHRTERRPPAAASASTRRAYPAELAIIAVFDGLVAVCAVAVTWSAFTAVTAVVAVVAWRLRGLYDPRIGLSPLDDLPALTAGTVMGMGPAMLVTVGWTGERSATVLATGALLLGGVMVGRTIAYATIRWQRANGRLVHRALMVGAGTPAQLLLEWVGAHPESGLHLVGTVTDRATRTPRTLPVLGSPGDLAEVVRTQQISDVIIGYGGHSTTGLVDVLRACGPVDACIYVVPRLFELAGRPGDDHIWGLPLARVRGPAHDRMTWRLKRSFDIAIAALGLVLAAPVLLAVAVAVRFELGPGVLFTQVRVGAGGRTFKLLKFRSLSSPPAGTTAPWAVPADGLGRVGRFIRRYSLDELPQLFNVLRGEMSMVGPRPERPEYVARFSSELPWYRHRHRVPSGLTGLAAVNGLRGDTSIEDRARFDNWYIDNWSLWLDTKILVRTVWSVLTGTGA